MWFGILFSGIIPVPVQKFLGHSDPRMTVVYAHLGEKHLLLRLDRRAHPVAVRG